MKARREQLERLRGDDVRATDGSDLALSLFVWRIVRIRGSAFQEEGRGSSVEAQGGFRGQAGSG